MGKQSSAGYKATPQAPQLIQNNPHGSTETLPQREFAQFLT